MIDLTNETVLSLNEAVKILPVKRVGRRPHVATLYRWSQRGLRGMRLETIQVGGTRCTSVEALQRFFEALTVEPGQPSERKKHASRERLIERAVASLQR